MCTFENRGLRGLSGASPPLPETPDGARQPEPACMKWEGRSTHAQRPEPPHPSPSAHGYEGAIQLRPMPKPLAPQDKPVFTQLKPMLGARNLAPNMALFSGKELEHLHHHLQVQPMYPQPPQPAPPPLPG
ncbi:Krueppel-like factor 5 [Myotis davidii]|uniref:Krueppel-like factor 5 n=1 Tax=Myotis davidii TaxID=225400 RepID=L5MH27_MYODS|nr:Krueppel-like factor 5 [Myotis davidii]